MPTDEVQEAIDRYCAHLAKALRHLPPGEKDEVVEEIRSHVLERVAAEKDPSPHWVGEILQAVGDPGELAAEWTTDLALRRAATSRSPLRLLAATLRWATRGLAGFVAFILTLAGYGSAATFYACAFVKPFFPSRIGLWLGPERTLAFGFWNGRSVGTEIYGISVRPPASFVLGTLSPTNGPVRELLGPWFIPVGILLGALALVATTLAARWMIATFGLRSGGPSGPAVRGANHPPHSALRPVH